MGKVWGLNVQSNPERLAKVGSLFFLKKIVPLSIFDKYTR